MSEFSGANGRIGVAENVVAKLERIDPERAHEALLYIAHFGHLGIDAKKGGDNVYNGAVDNAKRMWHSAGSGSRLHSGAATVSLDPVLGD